MHVTVILERNVKLVWETVRSAYFQPKSSKIFTYMFSIAYISIFAYCFNTTKHFVITKWCPLDWPFIICWNSESRHGPSYVNEALTLLQAAQYWLTDDGIDNWIINNVRVSQTADGLVR